MTINELIDRLKEYDGDLEVATDVIGDYFRIDSLHKGELFEENNGLKPIVWLIIEKPKKNN